MGKVVFLRESQGLKDKGSLIIMDQEFYKSQWESFGNWVQLEDAIRK